MKLVSSLPRYYLQAMLLAGMGIAMSAARAEIYVYLGPDGRALVTDQLLPPGKGYRLQHRRRGVEDVGHIIASHDRIIQDKRVRFYDPYIKQASHDWDLDPALVKAVIKVESNFDPHAVSPKGALGLMQVMPDTGARYKVNDLMSPVANIQAGSRHLSYLLKRYPNQKLALAAYNAGEETVDQYGGVPPYGETQRYVAQVLQYQQRYLQHY